MTDPWSKFIFNFIVGWSYGSRMAHSTQVNQRCFNESLGFLQIKKRKLGRACDSMGLCSKGHRHNINVNSGTATDAHTNGVFFGENSFFYDFVEITINNSRSLHKVFKRSPRKMSVTTCDMQPDKTTNERQSQHGVENVQRAKCG